MGSGTKRKCEKHNTHAFGGICVGQPRPPLVPNGARRADGGGGGGGRDAFEGDGAQRRPQRRLDRRLKEVAKAFGGGYFRLQMRLTLALTVRGTVAEHNLGALEGYPPASLGGWGSRTETAPPPTPRTCGVGTGVALGSLIPILQESPKARHMPRPVPVQGQAGGCRCEFRPAKD